MSDSKAAAPTAEAADDQDNPRWRRRAEARPGEILDAAMELFVEKGFAGTRMEEIAQRAGVTKGTVYLYFESKEALFRTVVQDNMIPSLEEGERTVAEWTGTSAALLAELMRRKWLLISRSRLNCVPKLMTSEAANFPELARFYMEEVVHRGRRVMESVLRRGIERGEFRRDLDVRTAVRVIQSPLLNAAVHMQSLQRFDEEALDLDVFFDVAIDIILRGIAADGDKDGSNA